ncbi:MAG TPA: hypothetical protein ENI82_00605, partial [Bacteroidetes bacterium]|nr:hypothetical protein [Bacteroidota bacterium]
EITNFDIVEGTFILENSYSFFPKSTVHIIAINSYYAPRVRILLLKKNDYYFIAPDNGILSLLFDDTDNDEIRYLEYGINAGDLYHVIAKIVGEIDTEKPLEEIGSKAENINKKISIKPVISGNTIRATVIFIDKFGNAILNVTKDNFLQLGNGRNFELQYSPKNYINIISNKYSDVPFGDELCLFNSAGYLEIAVNMQSAGEILGLEKGSIVQITFE